MSHAETMVIAVAETGNAAAEVWKEIPHDEARLLTELKRLGLSRLRVCYEAGPTGFGLQRFLQRHDVPCCVVAPSLVPMVSGRRVKTDRRDARKLAQFLRSGDLTEVWAPDEHTEALRDLERAREDARLAERTARQQLLKFLLRHGLRFTAGTNWTLRHWAWLRQQQLPQEAGRRALADYIQTAQQAHERVARLTKDLAELIAGWALAPLVKNLQAFHGIQLVTAAGLAAETGNFQRFATARQFMAFVGLAPSENSSGATRRQGGITKTGNRHVRRLLIEAAWHYYGLPRGISPALQKRRADVPPQIVAIADKAQQRLGRKMYRLTCARKTANKAATALARELAGFIWAAACATTPAAAPATAAPAAKRATRKTVTATSRAAAIHTNATKTVA